LPLVARSAEDEALPAETVPEGGKSRRFSALECRQSSLVNALDRRAMLARNPTRQDGLPDQLLRAGMAG